MSDIFHLFLKTTNPPCLTKPDSISVKEPESDPWRIVVTAVQ